MPREATHTAPWRNCRNSFRCIVSSLLWVEILWTILNNGNNRNQLTAMQDAVDEALYKAGLHAKQIEGNNKSTWILMDYEDIIVHLFSKEDRLFYDLERIWRDGKIIEM